MKKLMICVTAMLLVLAIGAAALAAVSVQMTITPDKTTVARGETVTFTVSASQLENCRAGGIAVHYDASVFQYVEGKCLLTGTALSSFGMTNDIPSGVFAFSEGTTVEGGVFSFTMKVKDTAQLGSAAVSITASARDTSGAVSCNAAPVSLTILCSHSWSKWSKVDDTGHKRTCGLCYAEETAAHQWDRGAVAKEATCKEAGVKLYTCADCGGARTEELAKTENHSFGAWSDVDDHSHKRTCTVCTKEETAAHDWNQGLVIQVPTCKEAGVRLYTCADCNGTKTEELPKTQEHSFGDWVYGDESSHKKVCTVCTKEETAAHEWSHKETVAATCTEDGYTLTACALCSREKKEIASALGHDMVEVPAVAPTCTESGLTAGTVCRRCQTVGVAQREVPALEHRYENGVCTACGEPEGIPGDLDGSDQVDEDDAVFLLQHVLMPDLFPVTQEVDYDGNGQIDEDDAVFLLQHILMPDLFPL